MARGRMISKSLSTSEKFAALTTTAGELAEFCHALYPLLVVHSDDFGRLQGDPFTVKALCYPGSRRSLDEFAVALEQLTRIGLIVWFDVLGKKYVQIENFEKHQLGLHKRTRSRFPRIPGNSGNDQELPLQEKRTEEKRTKEEVRTTFDRFWDAYPKKVGKEPTWKLWQRLKPDAGLLDTILDALQLHRKSHQWVRNSGQFVPDPKTWVSQRRWEDELQPEPIAVEHVPWVCPHEVECSSPTICRNATILNRPLKVKSA